MRSQAIDQLTDLVIADAPKTEAGHVRELLVEATRDMDDEQDASALIHEFEVTFAWIELGFILTRDGGPYLEGYRNACLSILRDIAGGAH